MPKILLLNLPNKTPIIRRYQCSFNSHNFLFPPLELLYIAGSLKKNGFNNYKLIDCIAEKIKLEKLFNLIKEEEPNFIITLVGFENFGGDIDKLKKLKTKFSNIKFILFGYYPSLFYKEIIEYADIDYITAGEPEYRIINILKNENNEYNDGVLSKYNIPAKLEYVKLKRIMNLDELAYPDYSIIDVKKYSEPFIDKPFISIYTSRGCAYRCSYCIHSYGEHYIKMSAEKIIEKVKYLYETYKFKSLRFMDDNFTTDRNHTKKICEYFISSGLNKKIKWTCLSRIDCLDKNLIDLMAAAGCKRIYIGIETLDSAAQKVFNKTYQNYDIAKINEILNYLKLRKIESFSFLLIDYDEPSKIRRKISEFLKLNLDYISVCKLIVYPNTALFEKYYDKIEFNILPYKNNFIDKTYEKSALELEKFAIWKFYTKPKNIINVLFLFCKYPKQTAILILKFFVYFFKRLEHKQDFI